MRQAAWRRENEPLTGDDLATLAELSDVLKYHFETVCKMRRNNAKNAALLRQTSFLLEMIEWQRRRGTN